MHLTPDERSTTRHRQSAGAATRQAHKQRAEALKTNPINWDTQLARLKQIFRELEKK